MTTMAYRFGDHEFSPQFEQCQFPSGNLSVRTDPWDYTIRAPKDEIVTFSVHYIGRHRGLHPNTLDREDKVLLGNYDSQYEACQAVRNHWALTCMEWSTQL